MQLMDLGANFIISLSRLHGFVFVIDGSQEALPLEIEVLKSVLTRPKIRFIPLLILVNKQDLPTVRTLDNVVRSLEMSGQSRLWHIQATWLCNAYMCLNDISKA